MEIQRHNILITAMVLIALVSSIAINAQRTTRKGLRVETQAEMPSKGTADTIIAGDEPNAITIAGYDKPLRSANETFFITNRSSYNISGLRIRIKYLDTHGRTLHQRECLIPIDIPSGETRQAKIKSWDIQRSFYYKMSTKPKRADGTPFDVECLIISATLTPTSQNDGKSD